MNGANPNDLMAFGAYSRIRIDDEVGRVLLPCWSGARLSLLMVSLKIACSAVAPPRAMIELFMLSARGMEMRESVVHQTSNSRQRLLTFRRNVGQNPNRIGLDTCILRVEKPHQRFHRATRKLSDNITEVNCGQ